MRNDIHSPTNFDPAQYAYVGSFDQFPEPGAFLNRAANPWSDYNTPFGTVRAMTPDHADYLGGRNLLESSGAKIHYNPEQGTGNCDHCGARIRYVTIFRHASGEHIAVGNDCAANRFGCDSRREYDIKRLKEKAANAKERAKSFGRAATFCEEHCPELTEWLLSPAADTVHTIFADMARKLVKWGSISEEQVAFARKLMAEYYERQRNGGKTDREVKREEEKALAMDCPIGKTTIIGTVVKTEWRENGFTYGGGEVKKMVVKDDRGFLVWSTVPAAIIDAEKGSRVQFSATLERSDKDSKFGFGKRPTQAKFLESSATLAAV